MYKFVRERNGRYGVLDTSSGIIDYFDEKQIMEILDYGFKIDGIKKKRGKLNVTLRSKSQLEELKKNGEEIIVISESDTFRRARGKLLKACSDSCVVVNESRIADMSNLFSHIEFTSLNLSMFSVKNCKSMAGMFSDCQSLREVIMPYWDAPLCTDMSEMFSGCFSLERVDMRYFSGDRVENLSGIFRECKSLKKANLKELNVPNVLDMSEMFIGCTSIKSVDMREFVGGTVETVRGMFQNCASLQTVNLSGFTGESVKDMCHMFDKCTNMDKIYFDSIHLADDVSIQYVFNRCKKADVVMDESQKRLMHKLVLARNDKSKDEPYWLDNL